MYIHSYLYYWSHFVVLFHVSLFVHIYNVRQEQNLQLQAVPWAYPGRSRGRRHFYETYRHIVLREQSNKSLLIRIKVSTHPVNGRFLVRGQVHTRGLNLLQYIHSSHNQFYTVVTLGIWKHHCVVNSVFCLYVYAYTPEINITKFWYWKA